MFYDLGTAYAGDCIWEIADKGPYTKLTNICSIYNTVIYTYGTICMENEHQNLPGNRYVVQLTRPLPCRFHY